MTSELPRIAHVLDNLAIGGAQRMMMRFLANSSRNESRVIVVSRVKSEWEAEVEQSPICINFLSSSRLLSIKTWLSALSALRGAPAPIVHVHMQYASLIFLPIAKLRGQKTVVTLHNVQESGQGWRALVRSALQRIVMRVFADKVVSVGTKVTDVWKRQLPSHDILTIPNSVPTDIETDPNSREITRRELGVAEDAVVIIAVASLSEKKNLPSLIEAFSMISGDHRKAVLWIVGTGPLRESLARQIGSVGLTNRISLFGARTDIPELLVASDIFALSSSTEGLPISMLEAMAARIPVVVPDVGDITTVVNSQCGIVFQALDTIGLSAGLKRLVANSAMRRELGEAARKTVVEDHSEIRWLEQMRRLYQELASPQ